MKILFATSSLSSGGAERVISGLASSLVARGFDVGLLTFSGAAQDHYPLDERVERIALDLFWPSANPLQALKSNARRSLALRSAVMEFDPDVLVSFIDKTNIRVLASLMGTGIPVVISERTDPREAPLTASWRMLRKLLYPRANALVVQTESVAAWARSLVDASRVHVIPNAVTELPAPAPYQNRSQLVVAIGRLSEEKGIDILLRGFAGSALAAEGWRLRIVGDGPERAALEALANVLELTDSVAFVGTTEQPWVDLNAARIYVLSSRFEGFPNALLEAMAMGCTCIAADCPSGPADIVEDRVSGLLIEPDSPEALAAALRRCIESPRESEAFAHAAVAARERFAEAPITDRWVRLLEAEVRS